MALLHVILSYTFRKFCAALLTALALNGNSASQCGLNVVCMFNMQYAEKTANYLFTKKTYHPATENSPLFAVDCEMVRMSSVCGCATKFSLFFVHSYFCASANIVAEGIMFPECLCICACMSPKQTYYC